MAEDLIDTVRETVKFLRKAVLNYGTRRPMSQMSARHFATWPINARRKPASWPGTTGSIDSGLGRQQLNPPSGLAGNESLNTVELRSAYRYF